MYKYLNLGEYLDEENRCLQESVEERSALIEFGCGNCRHLKILEAVSSFYLGIDFDPGHIKSAWNLSENKNSQIFTF
ncbi:hypothetical protein Misp06_01106 [Microbulbifer sp. NBRC 101763]